MTGVVVRVHGEVLAIDSPAPSGSDSVSLVHITVGQGAAVVVVGVVVVGVVVVALRLTTHSTNRPVSTECQASH